jgi:hypothetical protein
LKRFEGEILNGRIGSNTKKKITSKKKGQVSNLLLKESANSPKGWVELMRI